MMLESLNMRMIVLATVTVRMSCMCVFGSHGRGSECMFMLAIITACITKHVIARFWMCAEFSVTSRELMRTYRAGTEHAIDSAKPQSF